MTILVEHKKKYLERRLNEIEELRLCLSVEDYDVAVNIGHRLKGNGETFGYPEISVIGNNLEQAALAKDKVKMDEAVKELIINVEKNLKEIFTIQ